MQKPLLTDAELLSAEDGIPIYKKSMIEEGFPSNLFMSDEERKAAWRDKPPRPMPAFGDIKAKALADPTALAMLAEAEQKRKSKAKTRIQKMLERKVDRTGQRWDARRNKWVLETEKPVIVITTNTRGATKMKDYAEMSLTELAEAYNKISGKDPIKKFKDKATGLKRMAEAQSAKAAAAAAKPASDVVRKPKKEKVGSENKLAAEFNARVGTNREKVIIALDENFKKQVPINTLLKAVYGSQNQENIGALKMVISGVPIMIDKYKLPYELKKEKVDGTETYGLYPKK